MLIFGRVDVIVLSDREIEIHYRPSLLARCFGARRYYSPLVRAEYNTWRHKYSGRDLIGLDLERLEKLAPPGNGIRRQLLLDAADEAETIQIEADGVAH